ncbi:MAG: DUF3857 domain-containing protein [bacterium]|nr:DUF3857 domain-containing protein [bacterium]
MTRCLIAQGCLPLLMLLAGALPSPARPFPAISDEERALTEVPGHPGAPAVVLFKRAELRLRDPAREGSSTLDVTVRIKILTADGRRWGEVVVAHSASLRLQGLEGRTVLPDGRAVALLDDAVFVEQRSRVRQRFVTKAAFPALTPGAIIDYRFTLRWDSLYFLEPWLFHHPIPTRLAEITYWEPVGMRVEHRGREPADQRFRTIRENTVIGRRVRLRLEDLPAVAEEPFSVPFADLASYVVVVPLQMTAADGTAVPLLDSWSSVCRSFDDHGYRTFRRKRRQAAKQARELAAAAPTRAERIAAIYAFVRDEIQTSPDGGVLVGRDTSVDRVLAERRGGYAEKALVLQEMARSIRVPARLVWAGDWRDGRFELTVANPALFERVLVMVELDGRRVFLDPGDRRLGFGRLAPTNEGTRALVFDRDRPEVITLPESPAQVSRRRAVLDLELDGDGRLSGRGTLRLDGHHAWFYLRRKESPEATDEAWEQWLRNAFEGFEISGVRAEEAVDDERIDVVWSLVQHAEEVLGDECSLRPSLPLGPTEQRYTIPPERRQTPVRVSFADRDEVELRLAWPAGWEVDLVPAAVEHEGAAGAAIAHTELDGASRRLIYRRSFEITGTVFPPGEPYAAIRELYTAMERHDAETLVLVRRD